MGDFAFFTKDNFINSFELVYPADPRFTKPVWSAVDIVYEMTDQIISIKVMQPYLVVSDKAGNIDFIEKK